MKPVVDPFAGIKLDLGDQKNLSISSKEILIEESENSTNYIPPNNKSDSS